MKKIFLLVTLLLYQSLNYYAQNIGTVSGKIVDQIGIGLRDLQLKLYISPKVYSTSTTLDGSFSFNNISDVLYQQLPTGYRVSECYPNPFNPITRINLTLPYNGNVKVNVFNLLGQAVIEQINLYFSAGSSYFDLEMNGLPNGVYLAKITLDEKYLVTRKLMLLYGSQHLKPMPIVSHLRFYKSAISLKIDSLEITGPSITRKVLTNLPTMTGSSLDLGKLILNLPPQPPTLMGPSDGATNLIIPTLLIWNTNNLATNYSLQVSKSNLFTNLIFNQIGIINTSQQISELDYSTIYYWRVNGTNNYGTSNWSQVRSFTTQAAPPPPQYPPNSPVLVSPANSSTNLSLSPTLVWNSSNYATSYTLQMSMQVWLQMPDVFNDSTIIYNQNVGNNTSQLITGLFKSTKYAWRVSATNSYGTSLSTLTWTFTTVGGPTCPGIPSITYQSKTYSTVQIGNQCWLAENLDVGTTIPANQNPSNNGVIEKYCTNPNDCTTAGGLYTWNEAMQYVSTVGNKGICPTGWHIPTLSEFQILSNTVNGNGSSLKSTLQLNANIRATGGTNTSGFAALLAGDRWKTGEIQWYGNNATFWTSNEHGNPDYAYTLGLTYNSNTITIIESTKDVGFSVRCLKD